MSNTNFNVTRMPLSGARGGQQPASGPGQTHKQHSTDKTTPLTESTATTRTLAPLTRYDADLGIAVPIDPSETQEDPAGAPGGTKTADPDRHAKWKEQQAAKKAERETARTEKAATSQLLAKDLLAKGDLVGAAKTLGMTPAELSTLVTHATLGMPTKPEEPKKLSPEEQRVADETKFKEDRLAFEKEVREYNRNKDVTSFIEKNIAPELQNKDKYEMIHAASDIPKISAYVYEYMNQHYLETSGKNEDGSFKPGEVLKASDILESIEETMYKAHVQSLERAKKIKKVSSYFAPPKEEVEAEEPNAEVAEDLDPWARRRTPQAKLSVARPEPVQTTDEPDLSISQEKPMELNVQRRAAKEAGRPSNWRSLSAAEKLAVLRREEEAEKRKSSVK